jgi:phage replication-related protein YjqB (UPF0714/DUF867 family)
MARVRLEFHVTLVGQQEHPEITEMDVDRTEQAMKTAVLTHALEVQLHGFVSHWCMKATYNGWTETAQDADMEKYLQACGRITGMLLHL